jgi:hypothetical protein
MRNRNRADIGYDRGLAVVEDRPGSRGSSRVRRGPGSGKRRACPCGKVRFKDHQQAVTFLHHAENARRDAEAAGVETTHRAVRSYRCGACSGYHVTSLAA